MREEGRGGKRREEEGREGKKRASVRQRGEAGRGIKKGVSEEDNPEEEERERESRDTSFGAL